MREVTFDGFSVLLMSVAAVALMQVVAIGGGSYHPFAASLLLVSVTCWIGAILWPKVRRAPSRMGETPSVALFAAAIVLQAVQLSSRAPTPRLGGEVHTIATVAMALLALGALSRNEKVRNGCAAGLLAALVLVGIRVVTNTRTTIDVAMFHRIALDALTRGDNPYAVEYPNLYPPEFGYYAAGLVAGDKLLFGFPYPPASLLQSLVGRALGDPRYALLVASLAASGLMAWAAEGRLPKAAAALFVLAPYGPYMLAHGWTDPLLLPWLFASVVLFARAPGAWPWLFGVFLATKQYSVIVLPAVPLLFPDLRKTARALAISGAVALALTLPFALWDWPAFFRSVVALQFEQPYRDNTMSFLATFAERGAPPPPSWWSFVALAPVVALILWRPIRGPAGFASAAAALVLTFFAFGKQSFMNTYVFVIASMGLAIAVSAAAYVRNTSSPNEAR